MNAPFCLLTIVVVIGGIVGIFLLGAFIAIGYQIELIKVGRLFLQVQEISFRVLLYSYCY